MGNLTATYVVRKRWAEEGMLKERMVEAHVVWQGEGHSGNVTITFMRNLASTYWDRARWVQAESLL